MRKKNNLINFLLLIKKNISCGITNLNIKERCIKKLVTLFKLTRKNALYPKGREFLAALEERVLINDDLIAFTDKLVYKYGEDIILNLINLDHIKISICNISQEGKRNHLLSLNHSEGNSKLAVYSNFNGIISQSESLKIESNNLPEGWISIKLENIKNESVELPILIDPQVISSSVLFVESSDTLLAYNQAYDKYNIPNYYYKNLSASKTSIFPRNTPITYEQFEFSEIDKISCNDHLLNADMVHKRNLIEIGLDFQSISDNFLDNGNIPCNVKTIIFGSHNEYWTEEKAKNIMQFIDRGGKVLLLGGNTAWRQIYREQSGTWIHGHGLLENKTFKKLIYNYLGTYFTSEDSNSYAGYQIVDRKALLNNFGINLNLGRKIGMESRFKHCLKKVNGTSGHETDKLTNSSVGFKLIASGTNKPRGADLVYKEFASGGKVLNFSSISLWHNQDPIIIRMIEIFLEN